MAESPGEFYFKNKPHADQFILIDRARDQMNILKANSLFYNKYPVPALNTKVSESRFSKMVAAKQAAPVQQPSFPLFSNKPWFLS